VQRTKDIAKVAFKEAPPKRKFKEYYGILCFIGATHAVAVTLPRTGKPK